LSQIFNCSKNKLTALPVLPSGLKEIDCSFNLLVSLAELPPNLSSLTTEGNQLTGLPTLPSTLTILYAKNNRLLSLPALPASLYFLNVQNNLLACLPELKNSSMYIYIDANKISCLPNIPVSLFVFNASNALIPTPPVCPDNINHTTGAVPASLYVAKEKIESVGTLAAGTTNYIASQSITLNPGFVVSNSTTFLVEVRTCK